MTPPVIQDEDDALLVSQSLSGSRQAFERIILRYQAMVCSLAYSETGSIGGSEDLSQEVFVTAWKELANLREPSRLGGWLRGIARNIIRQALRRQSAQPLDAAQPLAPSESLATSQPSPPQEAIRKEEEAILWQSVGRLPESYRTPLILFYREHQSIERVARALELSESAAKQRISRGRKLLRGQMAAFVEQALERSSPGKAFAAAVVAALPSQAVSIKASVIGATAAKGSALAKSAAWVAWFNALAGPAIGLLGAYLGVRQSIDETRTSTEKRFAIRQIIWMFGLGIAFDAAMAAFVFAANRQWNRHPFLLAGLGIGLPLGFTILLLAWIVKYNRGLRQLRLQERELHPEAFGDDAGMKEYRSSRTLLGLPLVHITGASPLDRERPVAVGWIAIGYRAVGVIFAAGGVAVGGISMGGLTFGILSFGGVCLGLVALGGCAVGGVAVGGIAVGVVAIGGAALGWLAAEGGIAAARYFACGGLALARHANDAAAEKRLLNLNSASLRNVVTICCWLPLLIFMPIWIRMRKRRKLR